MNDSILRTRVESLRRNLKALDNKTFWDEMAMVGGQSAGPAWLDLVHKIRKPVSLENDFGARQDRGDNQGGSEKR